MKQKLLFTLCASILTLGISSCGTEISSSKTSSTEGTSEVTKTDTGSTTSSQTSKTTSESTSEFTSESSTSIIEDNANLAQVKQALTNASSLVSTKTTKSSLSIRENEYRQVEVDGVQTLKNTRYSTSNNTLSFFANKVLSVEEERINSATNDTEEITKTKTNYGIANGVFVKEVSDYSKADDKYEVNSLKSKGEKVGTEISEENTNNIFANGLFNVVTTSLNKKDQSNPVAYITANYLDKFKNGHVNKEENTYSLSAEETTKDDVDKDVFNEYQLTLSFNNDGALINAEGTFAAFESNAGVKGNKNFEYIVNFNQEVGTRANSDLDFDKYFFQNEEELSIGFSTTKLGTVEDNIKSLDTPYFIRVTKNLASKNENIDKVKLFNVTNTANEDCSSYYELVEEDDATKFILKKAGSYTLHFKTTKIEDIQIEISVIANEITSIAFPELVATTSVFVKDNEYLPGAVLKGETPFAIEVGGENATDDISFSISGDDSATVTKTETAFNYKLNTTKASTLSIKATSKTLGESKSITKQVKVYDTTDEGIAAFIGENTWVTAPNGGITSISFGYENGTSGTFEMVNIKKANIKGTYTVTDGAISIEITENPNKEAGIILKKIKYTPGRGDLVVTAGRDCLLQN